MNALAQTNIRLIASARTWIEAEAVRQLCAAANFDGVRLAVGLPDLHAGPVAPTGAAFMTERVFYPHWLGADIGCGTGLWKTSLSRGAVDPDRWAEHGFDLEHPWEGNARERLTREELCATQFTDDFGTLGGGQHFAELHRVEKVFQPACFRRLGLAKDQLTLLVHAGSGEFGRSVLETHQENHGACGLEPGSSAATRYRLLHDHAVRWARANRAVLAERFLGALNATGQRVLDVCHNSLTEIHPPSSRPSRRSSRGNVTRLTVSLDAANSVWVHRCGAAPADAGPLVIPGSSGTFSYLVQPVSAGPAHAWSLARGAGRRWTRSEARVRVRERYELGQLTHTGLGGRVVCGDRFRLYEEAAPAYKDIEGVIADLTDAGLIEVVATLRPLLTYKTRAER